jgi:hypothetical protein
MEEILLWIRENWLILTTGGGLAALLAFISNYLISKVFPKWLSKLSYAFAKVISNLFGMNIDSTDPIVSELPVVNELRQAILDVTKKFTDKTDAIEEKLSVDYSMQLIAMKEKLSSPLYTALEKAPYQAAYDLLFAKAKNYLPKEILDALAMLDSISKQG